LVADGSADEIRPIGIKTLFDEQVNPPKVNAANIDRYFLTFGHNMLLES
jgi:hypothetical protein